MPKLLPVLSLLILSALPLTSALAGVEKTVRLELQGTTSKPVDMEVVSVSAGGKTSFADWAGADRTKLVIVEFPATRHWQQGTITVKPLKSGRLAFVLAGPYVPEFEGTKQLRPIFSQFDNISGETGGNSALIVNGSFEKRNSSGAPDGWIITDTPNSNPPLDETMHAKVVTGDAAEGDQYVRTWHNSRCWQGISVEEGVPVTITFSYRLEK